LLSRRKLNILLLLLLVVEIFLQGQESDHLNISLFTYAPGTELYSIFGHSALRVKNNITHEDFVYNYGTFDFDEPNFYLKFLKGRLPYHLSRLPTNYAIKQLQKEGRTVTENVLNLAHAEKQLLNKSLEVNYLPENRSYNYDFFFDNCATRIAIIIDSVAKNRYATNSGQYRPQSFKSLISPYLNNHRWAKFGVWIAMGNLGNKKADYLQSTFLPDNLKIYLANHYTADNSSLLGQDRILISATGFTPRNLFSPVYVLCLLLVVFIVLAILESRNLKRIKIADIIVFGLTFPLSLILLFLSLISEHNIYGWNANLLWIIPFPIYYLFKNTKIKRVAKIIFGIGLIYAATQVGSCLPIFIISLIIATRFISWREKLFPDIH
jgi:hypothetical protein